MAARTSRGSGPPSPAVARERLLLLAAVGLYLFLCRTRLYSGDGLVYADEVARGLVSWNPNHLLMNPLAHAWTALLAALSPVALPPIVGLKLLSGVATVASVLLFHRVLVALPVPSGFARVGLALGLCFSRGMLSMAISEEFFVVQIPVLVLVLGACLAAARDHERGAAPGAGRLLAIGAGVGLATLVSVNNVVLFAGLGAWLAGLGGRWRGRAGLARAALVAAGGGALLAPAFAAAYAASGASTGLLRWLVSYQGAAGSEVGRLYGIHANARDALLALARLGFGFVNNLVDGAGAGTLAKAALRGGGALEYVPDYPLAALGALALLAAAAASAALLLWMARRRHDEVVLLSAWWMAGFLAFDLFWDNSDDQFWFAILPVLWVCAARAAGLAPGPGAQEAPRTGPRQRAALAAGVASLLVVNTAFTVAPAAFVEIERSRAEHRRLLSPGALEIYPGWDYVTHLFAADEPAGVRRVALLDVALGRDPGRIRMEELPGMVEAALREGRRVVVARLYDRDRFPNPWENLARLDWPRARILGLLAPFPARELARIDGLVFRELALPPSAGGSRPAQREPDAACAPAPATDGASASASTWFASAESCPSQAMKSLRP